MAELRWNPLIKDWVMIASHRQNRPQMPKDWCPFCPGSGKVPDHFTVYEYDNDFPALSQNPPVPDDVETRIYKTKPAYGKCEVILYSPEHTVTLPELPVDHIRELVDLWTERFVEISKDEKIKYVFIFENRGDVVGVTMPHPHGQIYGYSVIPKKLQLEMESCKEHFDETHNCLICDMLEDEMNCGDRIIMENEDFVTFLPFFSEYPYGMYIAAKRHVQNLSQLTDSEKTNLAKILKETTGTFDSLFDLNRDGMLDPAEQAFQLDFLTRKMKDETCEEHGGDLDLDDLEFMDEDERREALEDAGYDPDDFDDDF